MEELATELRGLGAEASVIGADLGRPGAAADLIEELHRRGIAIDVLINNAGLGAACRFERCTPERVSEMLQVNIVALTELTRALLPDMIARRRGRIMLVASVAAFQPGPHMAVYFATKAYVLSLGEALAYELRGTGVTVTTLCPGATATNFFNAAGATKSFMARRLRHMMRAEDVARIGYRALSAGRRVVITGGTNRIMALAGRYAPHRLTLPVTDLLMSGD
jgi:short-subunit dehydrogenase